MCCSPRQEPEISSSGKKVMQMPLMRLLDLEAQDLGSGIVAYHHVATGFAFELRPAVSDSCGPVDSHDDGIEEIAYKPLMLGAADSSLPDYLQVVRLRHELLYAPYVCVITENVHVKVTRNSTILWGILYGDCDPFRKTSGGVLEQMV